MSWILANPELSVGILTALILIFALIFAYKQLKDMAKDRHAQILLALSGEWASDTMHKARVRLAQKFQEARGEQKKNPKDPEAKLAEMLKKSAETEPQVMIELMKVADFYETLGLLVHKKMIHPPELALEIFLGSIINYWARYEKFIVDIRASELRPEIYEWFEYLYKLSKAYLEAKKTYAGPPQFRPSAKRLFNKLAGLFK